MAGSRQVRVKLRATSSQVALTAGLRQLLSRAQCHGDVIAEDVAFGNNFAERVDDHGVSIAHLIVVHSDGICEDSVNAVFIEASRQPTHQPFAAFGAVQLFTQRRGISFAVVPQFGRHDSSSRHHRRQASCHVWHEDHFGATQRSDADVFRNVVVIANQNAAPTPKQVEYNELRTARQIRVHEGVQLSELCDKLFSLNTNVCIEDIVTVTFKQSGEHRNFQVPADLH